MKGYFGLKREVNSSHYRVQDVDNPVVIEGAEVLDTLIPVSRVTGRRANLLTQLQLVTGKNAQLLESVLQDLPVLKSDASLTDQDRFDILVSRLVAGTPAEDATLQEALFNHAEQLGLFNIKEPENPAVASKIQFGDPAQVNSASE